jgi:ribonucleotide monophosphatase NagD (HAD superfamily)
MKEIDSIWAIADCFDSFVFDCDGVLYAGSHQIGRAAQVVADLEARNKKVFFVSNSSGRTRQQMASKL